MKTKIARNRAFHVIDVENEISSGSFGIDSVLRLQRTWTAAVHPGASDLFFTASGNKTKAEVAFGWPDSEKEFRDGKDGADDAIIELLSDVKNIAARFEHVYLGTGDHKMQPAVQALLQAGVKVTLVARKMHVHYSYYTTHGLNFIYLDEEWSLAA